jgi:spermidine/putrescine transport system substrate-binding protein
MTSPRKHHTTAARGSLAAVLLACTVVAAGCGGGGSSNGGPDAGSAALVPKPTSPDAPAKGTLRIFSYEDTVTPKALAAFRKANPDLKLEIATFDSNQEAAAKLRAGFEADVVNVCLDEMNPLTKADLLAPMDPAGLTHFADLAPVFTGAKGVKDGSGVIVSPDSAGPQGLIYNTKRYPKGVASFKDLFAPELKGRVTMDGGNALTPLAEAAMIQGNKDPMNLSAADVQKSKDFLIANKDQLRTYAQSDTDLINLYKSGEVVASDGGRGSAADLIDEGVPVKWVAPAEGTLSWVCGFSITSHAKNTDAAYKLINYYASPESQATQAEEGFVITNPKALPLMDAETKETADPAVLDGAIPESQPENFKLWSRAWSQVKAG